MFIQRNSHKLMRLAQIIIITFFISVSVNTQVLADNLSDIQRQLKTNQQTKQQKQQQQKKLEQQLVDSDQAIAKSSRQATQTKQKIVQQQAQKLYFYYLIVWILCPVGKTTIFCIVQQ